MAQVRWTPEASAWLESIFNFIALDDEDAARRTVTQIYDKAVGLVDFPRFGRLHAITPEGEIRIVLLHHYRIVYHLSNEETIDILGIYHGAIDIDRHL